MYLAFFARSGFEKWKSFDSPDDTWKLFVDYQDALHFGAHDVRVYYKVKDSKKRMEILTTSLSNNGIPLNDENLKVEWLDNYSLKLSLMGREQFDEVYLIDISAEDKVILLKE